jgi:thymidine phosphorylase
MFYLGGMDGTVAEGKVRASEIVASGAALDRFRQMVELQGGDVSVIDDPARLPSADCRVEVRSAAAGYVSAMACEDIGTACVILGGGREKKEDAVDPAVGIVVHKKIGDRVEKSEALCTIHCHSEASAERARKLIAGSYTISESAPAHKPALIHRVIYRGEN